MFGTTENCKKKYISYEYKKNVYSREVKKILQNEKKKAA